MSLLRDLAQAGQQLRPRLQVQQMSALVSDDFVHRRARTVLKPEHDMQPKLVVLCVARRGIRSRWSFCASASGTEGSKRRTGRRAAYWALYRSFWPVEGNALVC